MPAEPFALLGVGLLDLENLVQPADVPLGGDESSSEVRSDDLLCNGSTGNSGRKCQHIDVVMLDGLMCGVSITCLGAADPVQLVGGDGGTGTRTAHHNSSIGPSCQYRPTDGCGVVGVVDRLCRIGAQIQNRVTLIRYLFLEFFLQLKTGVI